MSGTDLSGKDDEDVDVVAAVECEAVDDEAGPFAADALSWSLLNCKSRATRQFIVFFLGDMGPPFSRRGDSPGAYPNQSPGRSPKFMVVGSGREGGVFGVALMHLVNQRQGKTVALFTPLFAIKVFLFSMTFVTGYKLGPGRFHSSPR